MEPISQTPHALSRLLKPHNEIQGQEVAWEGRATGVLATVPLGTLSPRLVMLVLVEGTACSSADMSICSREAHVRPLGLAPGEEPGVALRPPGATARGPADTLPLVPCAWSCPAGKPHTAHVGDMPSVPWSSSEHKVRKSGQDGKCQEDP